MTGKNKKKKKRLIFILFFGSLAAVFAVWYFVLRETKIRQGEITYAVTYPYNNFEGFTAAMLPKEVTVVFKDSKLLTTIRRGNIFQTQVYIDEESKEMEMRLDFGSDKFFTVLDNGQQENFKTSQPKYTISKTGETDSLSGLFAKKYTVKYPSDTVPPFDSWFTEDLSIQDAARISSYAPTKGMPLIYDIDRYGVRMHLEITGFKEREVDDKEFERSNELSEMEYLKYEKKLQDLFDVLTE